MGLDPLAQGHHLQLATGNLPPEASPGLACCWLTGRAACDQVLSYPTLFSALRSLIQNDGTLLKALHGDS